MRDGVHFHNGDPVTAEDVKFSFERYRGASHDMFKERVAAVETPDARHVRFTLKDPWPDFLTFYGSATGAGWVVPKKYVEKVGDDGFKKQPVGAGPYKFVSFTPGVELTLEANEGYWRKTPAVKRLVMRSIPDEATRLSALKGGEADIIYWVSGELAQELQRTPGLKLDVSHTATWWVYFLEQFDPKSPWHDVRVRQAASLAIDLKNINQAITLGHSKVTGNAFVPSHFEFFWQPPGAAGVRSREGEAAAGRGGASERDRCRPVLLRRRVFEHRRGDRQQPARGRHSRARCGRSNAPPFTRAIPKRS